MTDIIETGITWEHDTGDIVISTRSRRVANRLLSLGFQPDDPESDDYLTFRAKEADLRIRFARPRKLSEAQLAVLRRLTQRSETPPPGEEITPNSASEDPT